MLMVDGRWQPPAENEKNLSTALFTFTGRESPFAAAPSQHVVLFYATKYAKARVN